MSRLRPRETSGDHSGKDSRGAQPRGDAGAGTEVTGNLGAGGRRTHKGDFSDPPAWGGWASYRLWKKALIRWNQNTHVPVWRPFPKAEQAAGLGSAEPF